MCNYVYHSVPLILKYSCLYLCVLEKRKKPPDALAPKSENDRLSADSTINALSSAVNSTSFHKGTKRPRK